VGCLVFGRMGWKRSRVEERRGGGEESSGKGVERMKMVVRAARRVELGEEGAIP